MKKIVFSLLPLLFFSGHSLAIDAVSLEGDKKTACEVILCLASSKRPSECNKPLAEYFAIKAYSHGSYSPSKTIKKRKEFLELCPTESDDQKLDSLLTAESKQEVECSSDELNKRVATVNIGTVHSRETRYKTNSVMPEYCKALFNHEYAFYEKTPTYTCNNENYSKKDWNNGYVPIYNRAHTRVIDKQIIKKDCWVDK